MESAALEAEATPNKAKIDVDASLPPMLQDLLKTLDTDGKGFVSKEDVDDAIQAVRVRKSAPGLKGVRGSIMEGLGIRGDRVTEKDLDFVHQATTRMKEEKQVTRRLLFALVVVILLLTAAMFGVSFAAAELAKDTKVGSDGVITVSSGALALMGSAETMVVNGTLSRRSDSAVCTADSCTKDVIATRKAEEGHKLSSRIADEIFENLDRINFAISPPGGVTTQLTLRLHGFFRARNDNSVCGTVVHLITLHGTLTLDDQALHLDDSLTAYLESHGLDGIVLAQGQATGHGRRLQEETVSALGIFNYFDNLEFKCEHPDVQKPRNPRLPYMATLVKKRPCVSMEACLSTIFPSHFLPGYDAASDAIVTSHLAIVTKTKQIMVDQLPNHPGQELLTLTDHVAQTTDTYQFTRSAGEEEDNIVHRCRSLEYLEDRDIGLESAWWVTYLGEGYRAGASYNVGGITHDVPSSTNRVFRLASKNRTDGKVAFDFEDDPVTLLPRRLFLRKARETGMDVEEVLYVDFKELDESTASAEMDKFSDFTSCPDAESLRFPEMSDDVFDESRSDVEFYAHDFYADEQWRARLDEYWQFAISAIASEDFDVVENFSDPRANWSNWSNTSYATINTEFEDESDDDTSRRLVAPRRLQKPGLDSTAPTRRRAPTGRRRYVPPPPPPPPFNNEIENASYYDDASTLWWSEAWKVGETKLKSTIIWPSDGGEICYKVTGENPAPKIGGWFSTGSLAVGDYCLSDARGSFGFTGEVEMGYQWSRTKTLGDVVTVGCDLSISGFIKGETGNYKYNCGKERRRRRGSRRRECPYFGGKVAAGVRISGGCQVLIGDSGVGIDLSGELKFTFGPFPKQPLDSRAKGQLSGSVCVTIIEKFCASVGSWKFFDAGLGQTQSSY